MGIVKKESIFPKIESATCDCCKKEIKLNMFGELPDHAMIGGYKNGLLLEAIICIDCLEEKFSFVDIKEYNSTIGYC